MGCSCGPKEPDMSGPAGCAAMICGLIMVVLMIAGFISLAGLVINNVKPPPPSTSAKYPW